MQEGLVEEYNINNILEKESPEHFLQQITAHFKPTIMEATRRSLEQAELLQVSFDILLLMC